jgi:hypothetical protein
MDWKKIQKQSQFVGQDMNWIPQEQSAALPFEPYCLVCSAGLPPISD